MKANLYYIHGFGVTSKNPDIFIDIAKSFPEWGAHSVDLNSRKPNGEMIISAFSEQARRVENMMAGASENDVVIAHSQGAIIASLARMPRLKRVILLAPPPYATYEKMMNRIKSRGGERIDNGWSFASSNGMARYVSNTYLNELRDIDALALYEQLALKQNTVALEALNDEVLDSTDISAARHVKVIQIETDHNFTGHGRQMLINELAIFFETNQ